MPRYSFPPSGGGTDWSKLTPNTTLGFYDSAVAASTTADVVTITGEGILNEVKLAGSNNQFSYSIIVDGVEIKINYYNTAQYGIWFTGVGGAAGGTAGTYILHLISPIKFKNSCILRIKNNNTANAYTPGLNYSLAYNLK